MTKFYWSDFLKSEEQKLAQSYGVGELKEISKLHPRQPWRAEIDPLLRERQRARFEQRPDSDQAYEDFWAKDRLVLDGESQRYPAGETDAFLPRDRLRAFQEASEVSLAGLGFQLLPTRHVDYVAFQMQVSQRLSLRWSIEETDIFFATKYPCMCNPNLHLREAACTKRISTAKAEEFLFVPFYLLVDGFGESYYKCYESRHIKAVVYAYSVLLKYILSYVIASVKLVG